MKTLNRFVEESPSPIAVVCGLGLNGLGVVRSLGRRGVPTIGVDHSRKQTGIFSRYCCGVLGPDVSKDAAGFVAFMAELGRRVVAAGKGKGVLIPTSDTMISALSDGRDELGEYFEYTMPEASIVNKLLDKKEFYRALDALNLPLPKTFYPADLAEVRRISTDLRYPYIIKPVFSSAFCEEFRVKVFRAESAEELVVAYEKATDSGHEVVVQEMIPGSDENLNLVMACFSRSFDVQGILSFRRIRQYPRVFGNGALCVSTYKPELIDVVTAFARKTGYYGILDAELKYDQRDGIFKFIEVNPRSGWQNALAFKCGVNLPYMAYCEAIGRSVKPIVSRREGVKWLLFVNDLKSAAQAIRQGELTVGGYLRSLCGVHVCAIFAADDLMPWLAMLLLLAGPVARRVASIPLALVRMVVRRVQPGRRRPVP